MKSGLICIILLALAALLVACVATGVNNWYHLELPGDVRTYFGLWKICVKTSMGGAKCVTWGHRGLYDKAHWLHACQGTMLLAILLYLSGLVAILLHVTVLVHSRALVKLAGFLFILGGTFNCIAFIVFAAKYKSLLNPLVKTAGHLYAGFGLSVVAGLVGVVAGLVAVCIKQGSYESF